MKQYGIVCTVANLWSITVAGVKAQLVNQTLFCKKGSSKIVHLVQNKQK